MIFAESLESFLEAIYLDERITTKRSGNPIYVNPGVKNDYLVGKTVILTRPVEDGIIRNLKSNMNSVICRVTCPGTVFSPYITRINFKIQWNGLSVTLPEGIEDPMMWARKEDLIFIQSTEEGKVGYIGFPKITGVPENLLYDPEGNLTLLGWTLHQVGVNTDMESKYQDLDILKTKKLVTGGA